ncbi:MAG: 3D domain-containing protein [Erysipelotrichaceae bacterium]
MIIAFVAINFMATGILVFLIIDENKYVPIQYQVYASDEQVARYAYHFDYETEEMITEEPEFELIDPGVYPDGYSWLIHKVDDGSQGKEYRTYRSVLSDDDSVLSVTYVPNSLEVKEVEPILYSYGSPVEVGAYFYSDFTTCYGVNCVGCYMDENGIGGTSAGIKLTTSSVRQSDGTWQTGITYDGYYIIATDQSIPLCTVVEISSHGFSGHGLSYGEPFLAIVLDRGGAITGNDIDLYTGDETNSGMTNSKRSGVRVEIVEFGTWTTNSLGEKMCLVN